MKGLIQYFIRIKNPAFSFDPKVTAAMLISLAWTKFLCLVRGNIILLLHLKKPSYLFADKGISLFNASSIRFGKFVQLGDHVYLSGLGTRGIDIGDNSSIGAFSRIVASTSFNHIGKGIKIGCNVGIGEFAYLGGGGGLDIGDDCIIGQYLGCHPENHIRPDNGTLIRNSGVSRKGIRIGKNCWIGARVTLVDGVTIGDHCIIAAGAVVNKSFPDNSLIGGVPAKLIRSLAGNEKDQHVTLSENTPLFR